MKKTSNSGKIGNSSVLKTEELKYKHFNDVSGFITGGIKRETDQIESIYGIEDGTIEEIYQGVNENNVRSIYMVIEHAILVRHSKTGELLSLLCLLSKKFEYSGTENGYLNALLDYQGIKKNNGKQDSKEVIDIYPAGSVGRAIIEDSIDDFIRLTSDPSFDAKKRIKTKKSSKYEDPITVVSGDGDVSHMQLMALFGSKKCFKHAVSAGGYDMDGVAKYAIAGGDIDIIHILEQNGVSFDSCFETAVKFHRDGICTATYSSYNKMVVFLFIFMNHQL